MLSLAIPSAMIIVRIAVRGNVHVHVLHTLSRRIAPHFPFVVYMFSSSALAVAFLTVAVTIIFHDVEGMLEKSINV